MKMVVYANAEMNERIKAILSESKLFPEDTIGRVFFHNYDDFLGCISQNDIGAVIVAKQGAKGMEGARAVKILRPEADLIWISGDKAFGPESFRIGCTYFTADPISKETVERALKHIAK